MVNGEWQVIDGRHKGEEAARIDYAAVAENLRIAEVMA
jgi:hypothetical protein